jgi:hypothetical protein
MILFQQRADRKALLACGQSESLRPAVLAHRADQLLGALGSQTVVCGAQTPAGAFALVLESDAPVGALDALATPFDTNGSEEVESLLARNCITAFYAIIGIHDKPSYANLWQASSV